MDNNRPKQLTNFAKVIQVDKDGNPINQVNETNVIVEKKSINKKDIIIVGVLIIIILILLGILGYYSYKYIIPGIK